MKIITFASMRLKGLIYCSLFLLLVTGCREQKDVTDTLNCAETIMESTPDSAYALLQTLDAGTMKRRSTRARYALLYTQAQDKNYIDGTNDSLITVAVDYYRHHGDVRRRFLSLYYKGRIHSNAGDYLHAMLAYSEAEGLVPEVADAYYCGLLYSQLGDVYKKFFDFPKSLEAYQRAEEYYKGSDKNEHRLFAMVDQSNVYRNMNEYDESDSLLQAVLVEAEHIKKHSLIAYVLGDLTMQYVELGQVQKAKSVNKKMLDKYGIDNKTSDFMASVVKIYLSEAEIQEAERTLQRAWIQAKTANDSIACHLASSLIYKAKGQFDRAMKEQEAGVLIQNRLVKQNLQQPVLTMQRDYLTHELKHQSYKRKMNRILGIVVIAFIGVLTLLVGYFLQKRLRRLYRESLHRRLKQQEAENKQKMEHLWKEAMQREQSIRQRLEDLNREMLQKDEASIENIRCLQEELSKQGKILHQYKEQHESLAEVADRDLRNQRELAVSLLRSYFRVLDKIFVTYYCTDYVNDGAKHIALNDVLMKYGEEYFKCRNKKGYDKLEETVNAYMNHVMVHFREEMKLSKEEYYQQACFLFAGFSGKFIAYIMDTTPNTIYKRKVEFIKKIKEQEPLHAEIYLNFLSK